MNCNVCGKENAEHLWRCEDHHCCDGCGTKQGLCFRRGGLWCDKCHKKRVKAEISNFDGDTEYTSEITCPWCGYEMTDSWERSHDSDQTDCDNCGRKYEYERDVTVTYSTKKLK